MNERLGHVYIKVDTVSWVNYDDVQDLVAALLQHQTVVDVTVTGVVAEEDEDCNEF